MYINDIHILCYFFIGLLGIGVGQFLDWANNRLQNHERVICKELVTGYLPNMKINCAMMFSVAILYIAILYMFGFSIRLLEYLLLVPMFISVFVIDYKEQIIPNRLVLTIFEVGLVFAFIAGISSSTIFFDKIIGMFAGAGIFLLITLIGGAIAGKEAMGFGDVKLMGALGLIFGLINTIMITVLSFLLGAVISIILLVSKKKKTNEYIPFGPFIILATFGVMLVPYNAMLYALLKVFTLGTYKG